MFSPHLVIRGTKTICDLMTYRKCCLSCERVEYCRGKERKGRDDKTLIFVVAEHENTQNDTGATGKKHVGSREGHQGGVL
jgi:hypothetical protein